LNESEGRLYNILREKGMMQWSQQGGVSRGEGGRQAITYVDHRAVIIIVV
jgi:hypothetical protein